MLVYISRRVYDLACDHAREEIVLDTHGCSNAFGSISFSFSSKLLPKLRDCNNLYHLEANDSMASDSTQFFIKMRQFHSLNLQTYMNFD